MAVWRSTRVFQRGRGEEGGAGVLLTPTAPVLNLFLNFQP